MPPQPKSLCGQVWEKEGSSGRSSGRLEFPSPFSWGSCSVLGHWCPFHVPQPLAIPRPAPCCFWFPACWQEQRIPSLPSLGSLLPSQGFLESPEGFGDSKCVLVGSQSLRLQGCQRAGAGAGGQGDEEEDMNSTETFPWGKSSQKNLWSWHEHDRTKDTRLVEQQDHVLNDNPEFVFLCRNARILLKLKTKTFLASL